MDEQAFMTPKPELHAVVFDAGGTLVRIDFEWIVTMLAELGIATTFEQVRHAEVHGRRRYDAAAGNKPNTPALGLHPPLGSVAPTRSYFSGLLEAVGCRHPLLEEALERFQQKQVPPSLLWSRPMEGARQCLDALSAMGMRACCVSNSDGRAEHHLETTGNRAGLEFVIDSQIEGVEKPDPRIFHIALDRMGVKPEHAVYVGDLKSVDAAGARGAGMKFVLIDPYGDYADPDQLSVRRLDELPALLAERFTLVTARRGSSAAHS
ncbi:MAG: HAD family hydrolase [Candidatus Eisenbacteria bacterium]|nr:HAD family hydrolase [Candidatus Eisenbacteria bacterium]